MSSIAGKPLKDAIPGSSFFPMYCDYHAKDDNVKVFLLGAKEGVADIAKENINKRIGREIIVGDVSRQVGCGLWLCGETPHPLNLSHVLRLG